jgi:hypothetical protein
LAAAATSLAAPAAVPRVVGGTAVQRTVVRGIVKRFGPVALRRLRIVPAERKWRPFPRGAVELRVTGRTRNDLRAWWEGALVAASFWDRSKARRLPLVVAVVLPGAGGMRVPGGDGSTPPPATAEARETLREALTQAAADAGAAVDDLRIGAPDGVSGAIRLRVPDPAQFLHYRLPGFLDRFGGFPVDYEGLYVQVVDSGGRLVWAAGESSRLAVRSWRVRPDLAGCDPFAELMEPPPAPCPA